VPSYKQPRRLNAVSLTLLGLALLAAYIGYEAWPTVTLNADLSSAVEDALPRLYRANLLPEPESSVAADEIQQSLVDKLGALGMDHPEQLVTITRDLKTVAVRVRTRVVVDLPLLHLKLPITLNPHAETSAERVVY
jgi:hypothetical protein